MKGSQKLLQNEDRWVTQMGAAITQDPVMFRNRKLHGDLSELSWFEIYLYGITGKTFSPQEIQILNATWVITSYPDPRIWNNRVAALAGTVKSSAAAAVASAIAVSEADIYGAKPLMKSIGLLKNARAWVEKNNELEQFITDEIKKNRKLAGYGRPKLNNDERIKPMLEFLDNIDYRRGPYLKIAFEIEEILHRGRWRFRMNYAGLVASICADIGLSPKEAYFCTMPGFMGGFLPCYIDATEHALGGFFPMRCSRIKYEGPERRSWK